MDKTQTRRFFIFSCLTGLPHRECMNLKWKDFYSEKNKNGRYDTFKYKVSSYSCETHPHNTYLELLSEAGIFAFLVVAGLFILICYLSIKHFVLKLFRDKKGIINDFEVCLLSAMMISLWPF